MTVLFHQKKGYLRSYASCAPRTSQSTKLKLYFTFVREVDLLEEDGMSFDAYEIKSSFTANDTVTRGLWNHHFPSAGAGCDFFRATLTLEKQMTLD